jgi:hypothetical protein
MLLNMINRTKVARQGWRSPVRQLAVTSYVSTGFGFLPYQRAHVFAWEYAPSHILRRADMPLSAVVVFWRDTLAHVRLFPSSFSSFTRAERLLIVHADSRLARRTPESSG